MFLKESKIFDALLPGFIGYLQEKTPIANQIDLLEVPCKAKKKIKTLVIKGLIFYFAGTFVNH